MTHEESSLQTKKILCASLKKIMKHKAFSKITVTELIKDCNLNRKTFYYHFEDIYGLLKWMLEQEAFDVIEQFNVLEEYKDAFNFILDYVNENAYFLNCIYDSVGRDQLKRFFYKDFEVLTKKIIRDTEQQLNLSIDDHYRSFLCCFYTEAVAGMLINLFQNPEICDRDKTFEYFSVIIYNSLPAVLIGKTKKDLDP